VPVYTDVLELGSFLMVKLAAQSISESDAMVRGLTNHLQLLRPPSQEAVGTESPSPIKLSQKHSTERFLVYHLSRDVGRQVKRRLH